MCLHSDLCCVTGFLMLCLSSNSWSRWQKAPDREAELGFPTLTLWGLQMGSDNTARNFKSFIWSLNSGTVTPDKESCACKF